MKTLEKYTAKEIATICKDITFGVNYSSTKFTITGELDSMNYIRLVFNNGSSTSWQSHSYSEILPEDRLILETRLDKFYNPDIYIPRQARFNLIEVD